MAESNSGKIENSYQKKSSPYFFNEMIYPQKWSDMNDKLLVAMYRRQVRKNPIDSKSQLIVCFLLKRHLGGIILASRSFISGERELVEFTHDLFLKLVEKLKKIRIKKNFSGFLFTTITRMHLDNIRKYRPSISLENASSLPHPYDVENQTSLKLDFPLDTPELEKLQRDKVLSNLEYECIKYTLLEYKAREIADEINEKILGFSKIKAIDDQEAFDAYKLKMVYRALERARKKLRIHFNRDQY